MGRGHSGRRVGRTPSQTRGARCNSSLKGGEEEETPPSRTPPNSTPACPRAACLPRGADRRAKAGGIHTFQNFDISPPTALSPPGRAAPAAPSVLRYEYMPGPRQAGMARGGKGEGLLRAGGAAPSPGSLSVFSEQREMNFSESRRNESLPEAGRLRQLLREAASPIQDWSPAGHCRLGRGCPGRCHRRWWGVDHGAPPGPAAPRTSPQHAAPLCRLGARII